MRSIILIFVQIVELPLERLQTTYCPCYRQKKAIINRTISSLIASGNGTAWPRRRASSRQSSSNTNVQTIHRSPYESLWRSTPNVMVWFTLYYSSQSLIFTSKNQNTGWSSKRMSANGGTLRDGWLSTDECQLFGFDQVISRCHYRLFE